MARKRNQAKPKARKARRGNPNIASLGTRTRFAPGVSGNPGGRPANAPFAAAYREMASLPIAELKRSRKDSIAIGVAKATLREAMKGKISAAREAADRAEGTPRQAIAVEQSGPVEVRVIYDQKETLKKIREIYGLVDPEDPTTLPDPNAAKTPSDMTK
jgi:uncharacterized protein DUF5681